MADDVVLGERIFDKCKVCHTLDGSKNAVGPSLYGVLGRSAGKLPGYNFSENLRASSIVWTERNIDLYLANPKKFIPGNKMMFPGLKKRSDRANLIAFLKAKSG